MKEPNQIDKVELNWGWENQSGRVAMESLFSKVVTFELRQECWAETSHTESWKSLLEERHSKCKGTEARHVQEMSCSLMDLIEAVAELVIWVVLIFIQGLEKALGKSTGIES